MKRRPAIFNLTRLMGRMHSLAPTGVDRLDIRYARHFLDNALYRHVFFVHQFGNSISLVPETSARMLVTALWDRWICPGSSASYGAQPREKTIHALARLKSVALKYVSDGIDPALVRALRYAAPPLYINAGHTGVQHSGIHDLLRKKLGADIIYYLHDLIPIDYPEYVRSKTFSDIHAIRVASMASTGSLIIANSRYTSDRFRRFCNENGIMSPRCEVLEIGVEDVFLGGKNQMSTAIPDRVLERLEGKPYFVVVGTIEPRKNHMMLLQVWRQLAQDMGDSCPRLVLIGQRGWENENVVDMLERCPGVMENVIELNGISDAEMIPIIQHAEAMLYPSFEEGWGIPVTESLALGTPVICSDIPALRECSQGKARFLHPLDGIGWLEVIKSTIMAHKNCTGAEGIGRSMSNFEPVTWRRHTLRLDDMLVSLDSMPIVGN